MSLKSLSPLRCVIIDDDDADRQLLERHVALTPFMQMEGSYRSIADAARTVVEGDADIIFTGISRPGSESTDIAEIAPAGTSIAYVSADENAALQAYRANAIDFLLKPVEYHEFLRAAVKAAEWKRLSRAAAATTAGDDRYIIIKSDYKTVQIDTESIIYVEGQKDYVKFFLDREPGTIVSLINLKTLERHLPAGRFMRVHRSYIVNTTRITTIERNRLIFGNVQIPVSEGYKDALADYIRAHAVYASALAKKP